MMLYKIAIKLIGCRPLVKTTKDVAEACRSVRIMVENANQRIAHHVDKVENPNEELPNCGG